MPSPGFGAPTPAAPPAPTLGVSQQKPRKMVSMAGFLLASPLNTSPKRSPWPVSGYRLKGRQTPFWTFSGHAHRATGTADLIRAALPRQMRPSLGAAIGESPNRMQKGHPAKASTAAQQRMLSSHKGLKETKRENSAFCGTKRILGMSNWGTQNFHFNQGYSQTKGELPILMGRNGK